ncbi:MAG: MFS transporter [Glaciecola sp.]|nr:MFS transporter [Glaciecola sp.]MDG1815353.1 MFS transporter [Glaciecola sp.]MDG2099964.1 MFS transporter [Glaciecola sp.]
MSNSITPPSTAVTVSILGGLFFLFGFVTWLNGALVPYLQLICDLTETQALLVASSFYIAYVVMALPMSFLLDKVGLKQGMVLGLALMSVGLLLFIPAAFGQTFSLFLLAQFVLGSGLTILQTASNPYLVISGPNESAAARIAVMGILNKAAGVLAPLLFTALVLSGFSDVNQASLSLLSDTEQQLQIGQLAKQMVMPYLGLASIVMVLAFAMAKSPLSALEIARDPHSSESLLDFPHLLFGVIALFFYVGVEVIAADTIGLYGSSLGLSNVTALTAYTMVFMVVGYVLGLLCIPRIASQSVVLSVSGFVGLILCVLISVVDEQSTALAQALWGWSGIPLLPDPLVLIALLGLANAMVWPTIWPLAIAGLGDYTARGSAWLIMAIAGGALLPPLFGQVVAQVGYQHSYLTLIIGYIVIASYGVLQRRQR